MSMAAGEFVSVSSQADLEAADIEREKHALNEDPHQELDELTGIYVGRGFEPALARTVAEQLTAKDPLAAHARDELGLTDEAAANPVLAAFASAAAFLVGAALPTLAAFLSPPASTIIAVSAAALTFLIALGALGAWLGGAKILKPALRVGFGARWRWQSPRPSAPLSAKRSEFPDYFPRPTTVTSRISYFAASILKLSCRPDAAPSRDPDF